MLNETVPFVGRSTELAEMHIYGHTAFEENHGRVIFLIGEAGIGKTALGERFSKLMLERYSNLQYAYTFCSEITGDISPYTPFIQLHQTLLEHQDIQDENAKANWLLDYAQQVGPDFFDIVPVLGPVLKVIFNSATFAVRRQHDRQLASRQREVDLSQQINTFQKFVDSFRHIAKRNSLLLFIDDLHWADESSCNLLFHLSRQLADVPILILATFRPHEAQAREHPILKSHAEMQRYALCTNIILDFLTKDAVAEYLSQRFPLASFPSAFVEWLHKTTSGNALFLREYVELMIQDKLLTQAGQIVGDWSQISPPESVEGVIYSRIRYLDRESQEILTYASVEGEQFSTRLLEQVFKIDHLSLMKRLRSIELIHQLILKLDEHSVGQQPTALYKFIHALVYQAFYNELSTAERMEVSRILLNLQTEIFKQTDEKNRSQMLPRLISLAEYAADYKAKAKYALTAADEAAKIYAHAEVLKQSDLGLKALENLSPTLETETLRVMLLIKRGVTYRWYIGRWEQALALYLQAASIAQKYNEHQLLRSVYSSIG